MEADQASVASRRPEDEKAQEKNGGGERRPGPEPISTSHTPRAMVVDASTMFIVLQVVVTIARFAIPTRQAASPLLLLAEVK